MDSQNSAAQPITLNETQSPRTFISYSWSSPEHEAWVLQLATELEESGVEIILDKWDLREGADKYAFMEKMVTDPSVRKVVVVCDRIYAEKADGRKGGVGTETQIVSKELYEQVDPTDQKQKFVAVITEKDEDGKEYVPTFLKSRIYIDMSDSSLRTESFERLLRWIFDKPLYKRPDRGKPPAHIFADETITLGTSSRFRLASDALRQGKASAFGAVSDYFITFADNLNNFRIEPSTDTEFDDDVLHSIETFLPYRDELIDMLFAITRYSANEKMYEAIHRFLERLLPYGFWPAGRSSWSEWNADNFKFILNEVFLYTIAILLKTGAFDGIDFLTERGYYFSPGSPELSNRNIVGFTYFRGVLASLERRSQRLNLRRTCLMADILKERAKRSDVSFEDISQADLFLFLRDELHPTDKLNAYRSWFPYTLLYSLYRQVPFEVFARSQSAQYFEQVKVGLGIAHRDELVKLENDLRAESRRVPRWGFDSLEVATLIGAKELGARL